MGKTNFPNPKVTINSSDPKVTINPFHYKIDTKESLEKYGTLAFGYDLMNQLITFDKRVINASLWIAIVPEIYLDKILTILEEIFPDFSYEKLTPKTKVLFIARLQKEIKRRMI